MPSYFIMKALFYYNKEDYSMENSELNVIGTGMPTDKPK
ncbi:MAG: hypothetical protein K0Q47_1, partial [Sedimentibacter sp.]|nr:hypothetical protein [Sedimentibacter sp.]